LFDTHGFRRHLRVYTGRSLPGQGSGRNVCQLLPVGILKKSTNQLGDEPSGQVFCKLPVALQAASFRLLKPDRPALQ
jgi:hypothetical protein